MELGKTGNVPCPRFFSDNQMKRLGLRPSARQHILTALRSHQKAPTVWKSGAETKTGEGWAMRRKSTNTVVSVEKVALVIGECT